MRGLWALGGRDKHALRTKLRNLHLKYQPFIFDSFRDIRAYFDDSLKFMGESGRGKICLGRDQYILVAFFCEL